jgi:2-polyprenyl-6-methoxyphenol hydroxylase-like FAD-dependent oxidoreductase
VVTALYFERRNRFSSGFVDVEEEKLSEQDVRKPIVIVGGGPAGATLALMLVQRGIGVVLVEASRDFARSFRGEALMPSGLDALETMGLLPLLNSLPTQTISAWEFSVEGQPFFSVDEPMGSNRPCTLVSQAHFLAAVIAKAQQFEHFKFLQGEAVQELLWDGDRVSGVRLSGGLSGQPIEASLVVGCDGRGSIVRTKAGLTLNEEPKPFNILWFKIDSSESSSPQSSHGSELDAIGLSNISPNPFQVFVQGCNAFSVFRSSENQVQVGWVLSEDDRTWKDISDWRSHLAAASPVALAQYFQTLEHPIDRPLLLTVKVGRAPQWSTSGCLLLGDAAHPMSPIRAQGINMALRDATQATQAIAAAWAGSSDDELNVSIDRVLVNIQAMREPEICKMQELQAHEADDAAKLHNSALLRQIIKTFAPVIGPVIRQKWIRRQKLLRHGIQTLILD